MSNRIESLQEQILSVSNQKIRATRSTLIDLGVTMLAFGLYSTVAGLARQNPELQTPLVVHTLTDLAFMGVALTATMYRLKQGVDLGREVRRLRLEKFDHLQELTRQSQLPPTLSQC